MTKDNQIETWMFKEKGENINLIFSVFLTLILGIFLLKINLLITITAVVFGILYIKLQQAQLLGNALEITDSQFPEINQIFDGFKKQLNVKRVRLFITQDPNPNGFTLGFPNSSIILTSALVEGLTLDELSFVIGHELGHVKAKHNIILTFINPLGTNIPVATYLFSFWQRKAEYTCDKCSLILNKKIEPAIDTLMKVSIGIKVSKKINLDAYKDQLINSENSITKTSELLFDHPLTTNRVKKMVAFWRNNFIIN